MEKLDLTKILKNCPKGWKFYSPVWGDLEFIEYDGCGNFVFDPIDVGNIDTVSLNSDGTFCCFGECIIFPSKEQRDWSKFTAPLYKKERFDPKTLKPFDRVLAKTDVAGIWYADMVSIPATDKENEIPVLIGEYDFDSITQVIPYNDDTKHLIGTNEEAPEYYRYWGD